MRFCVHGQQPELVTIRVQLLTTHLLSGPSTWTVHFLIISWQNPCVVTHDSTVCVSDEVHLNNPTSMYFFNCFPLIYKTNQNKTKNSVLPNVALTYLLQSFLQKD